MKVSTKLGLGFGTAVVLGVLIAGLATVQMRQLAGQLDEVANNRMVKMDQFSDIKDNLNGSARAVRNIVISQDAGVREAEHKKIADLRDADTKLLTELDKAIILPRERDLYKAITDVRGPYNQAMDRVVELAKQGKTQEAGSLLFGEVREKQNVIFKAVDESTALQGDPNRLRQELVA